MNQTPVTILDILLGNNNFLIGQPVLDQKNTNIGEAQPFNELIQNILAQNVKNNGLTDLNLTGDKINNSPFTITQENQKTEKTVQNLLINITNDNIAQLPFAEALADESIINNQYINVDPVESEPILATVDDIPENVKNFNDALKALLPETQPVYAKNIQNIINKIPVEINSGKYEIVDAQIQNNNLELQIVSAENPVEPIKITLPAEILTGNDKNNIGVANNQRTVVDQPKIDSYQFEDILSKLNLKEIEIKTGTNITDQEKTLKPINVNLMAEASGNEILLKAQYNSRKITGYIENNANDLTDTNDTSDTSDLIQQLNNINKNTEKTNARQNDVNSDVKQTVIKAAVPDDSNIWKINNYEYKNEYDPSLKNKILFNNEKTLGNLEQLTKTDNIFDSKTTFKTIENKIDSFFNLDKTTVKTDLSSEKIDIQPVRFNLPDNLNQALKPNGQSIMIRVEPDHLGPAQIKLTIEDDKLKAEIKVHSATAKTTLENSVDKLIQQLSKADIKVDYIEITADSDNSENELYQRQQFWNKGSKNSQLRAENNSLKENNINITPVLNRLNTISVGSGVNLLA